MKSFVLKAVFLVFLVSAVCFPYELVFHKDQPTSTQNDLLRGISVVDAPLANRLPAMSVGTLSEAADDFAVRTQVYNFITGKYWGDITSRYTEEISFVSTLCYSDSTMKLLLYNETGKSDVYLFLIQLANNSKDAKIIEQWKMDDSPRTRCFPSGDRSKSPFVAYSDGTKNTPIPCVVPVNLFVNITSAMDVARADVIKNHLPTPRGTFTFVDENKQPYFWVKMDNSNYSALLYTDGLEKDGTVNVKFYGFFKEVGTDA